MTMQDTIGTGGGSLDLFVGSAAPTMSSREIADLCETRHNQVVETIERLFEKGVLRESRKTTRPYHPEGGGRPTEVYDLTKRDTLVVVSGYNDELRARIIDRWTELEARVRRAPALPDFTNPIEAARAWANECEQKQLAQQKAVALAQENAEFAPKAAAHDRIAESFGSVCRKIAAKNLGVPPKQLNRWMATNGWTYPHGRDTLAYQSKIAAGFLEHKVETGDKDDGTTWTSTRVHVTPKGMLALAKAFPPAVKSA